MRCSRTRNSRSHPAAFAGLTAAAGGSELCAPRASKRRGRRRPRDRGAPIGAEEKALRRARRRANAKASVYTHWVAYLSVLALILIATRNFRVTLIVASAWGIGLFIHHFVVMTLSEMRQRWIDEEVGRGAAPVVDRDRRVVGEAKVRSLEDISTSIAREIRNPVTAAKELVQRMGEDPRSAGNVDFAAVALGELDRVERSISHLLRYARDEVVLRLETLDVASLIESALDSFEGRVTRSGVLLVRDIDDAGFVRGDAEKLRSVVINLVANGLDALEAAGVQEAKLEVAAGENLAGTEAWIRVRDNGAGMSDEALRKVFDPFFTTKAAGTGLGLALAKKMIEAHGGDLDAESSPGFGTVFTATFPRDPEAETHPEQARAAR